MKTDVWIIATGWNNVIIPIGNGYQNQYPVFPTRREARDFLNKATYPVNREPRIVKAFIQIY